MPTRITHFLHHNPITGSQVLGTSFTTGNVHVHDLHDGVAPLIAAKKNFFGIVDSIQVVLTNLGGVGGPPSKVTIRLCEDAAGDIVIVPDTEADLVTGITTNTTGNAVFKVGTIIRQDLGGPGNGTLYLFVKVDTGTATFAGSECFWQE